ncbi:MAG: hypothetical protein WAL91_08830, partial [Propionicimonas sp.]
MRLLPKAERAVEECGHARFEAPPAVEPMSGPPSAGRRDYAEALAALPRTQVRAYLSAHSGLPGPRANLTLLDAAGDVLPAELALELAADTEDEYLACCGVVTVGRLILEDPQDPSLVVLLSAAAADRRWRVREAAAIAAQRIG